MDIQQTIGYGDLFKKNPKNRVPNPSATAVPPGVVTKGDLDKMAMHNAVVGGVPYRPQDYPVSASQPAQVQQEQPQGKELNKSVYTYNPLSHVIGGAGGMIYDAVASPSPVRQLFNAGVNSMRSGIMSGVDAFLTNPGNAGGSRLMPDSDTAPSAPPQAIGGTNPTVASSTQSPAYQAALKQAQSAKPATAQGTITQNGQEVPAPANAAQQVANTNPAKTPTASVPVKVGGSTETTGYNSTITMNGKTVPVVQGKYTASDGTPTSDWSKTADYAQGVANAKKTQDALSGYFNQYLQSGDLEGAMRTANTPQERAALGALEAHRVDEREQKANMQYLENRINDQSTTPEVRDAMMKQYAYEAGSVQPWQQQIASMENSKIAQSKQDDARKAQDDARRLQDAQIAKFGAETSGITMQNENARSANATMNSLVEQMQKETDPVKLKKIEGKILALKGKVNNEGGVKSVVVPGGKDKDGNDIPSKLVLYDNEGNSREVELKGNSPKDKAAPVIADFVAGNKTQEQAKKELLEIFGTEEKVRQFMAEMQRAG